MRTPNNIEEIQLLADKACQILKESGIILYPTDTIWGIGCDATNPKAIEKVSLLKNRPESKSYVILVADAQMLSHYVTEVPDIVWDLLDVADKPMTIIYPKGDCLPSQVLAPDGSVAIRIPNHQFCQSLLRRLRRPLLSTSANLSGEKAASRYTQINPDLIKKVDWCAPSYLERGGTGAASSIIKIGLTGEVEIIRP